MAQKSNLPSQIPFSESHSLEDLILVFRYSGGVTIILKGMYISLFLGVLGFFRQREPTDGWMDNKILFIKLAHMIMEADKS